MAPPCSSNMLPLSEMPGAGIYLHVGESGHGPTRIFLKMELFKVHYQYLMQLKVPKRKNSHFGRSCGALFKPWVEDDN